MALGGGRTWPTKVAASAPARPRRGRREVRAASAKRLPRGVLALDVLLDNRERSAAAGNRAVRPAPEDRLAIDPVHFGRVLLADQARGRGLQVIHEAAEFEVGRQGDE